MTLRHSERKRADSYPSSLCKDCYVLKMISADYATNNVRRVDFNKLESEEK